MQKIKPQEIAIFLVLVILQLTGSTGFSLLFVDVATSSCIEIIIVCAVSSMEQISSSDTVYKDISLS